MASSDLCILCPPSKKITPSPEFPQRTVSSLVEHISSMAISCVRVSPIQSRAPCEQGIPSTGDQHIERASVTLKEMELSTFTALKGRKVL